MNMPSSIPALSHCPIPYSVGQWDKTQNGGTLHGTGNSPVSLKALSGNLLRSVPHGTSGGTSAGQCPKTVGQEAFFSGHFVPRWAACIQPKSRLRISATEEVGE
jgi:hypothetical protein